MLKNDKLRMLYAFFIFKFIKQYTLRKRFSIYFNVNQVVFDVI